MSQAIARRHLLQAAIASAAVVAFNPVSRVWATEAEIDSEPEDSVLQVPPLDGQLLLDAGTQATAADDFGHIIHQSPWAVLVPGSIRDIRKMVKFARTHSLSITGTRGVGQSHSSYGQAQVDGGIIVDMSGMNEIGQVGCNSVWVQAGARWSAILQATLPYGKSPPTLTDYIELSVGGTISAGGIGGMASKWARRRQRDRARSGDGQGEVLALLAVAPAAAFSCAAQWARTIRHHRARSPAARGRTVHGSCIHGGVR